MPLTLEIDRPTSAELAELGQVRVKDTAFDAVRKLWAFRCAAGLTQVELAARINRDPAWVSRNMKGPKNWTFKTFGALVEALDGEVEIRVAAKEDKVHDTSNHRAYDDFSHRRSPVQLNAKPVEAREPAPPIRIIAVSRK